MSVFIFLRLPLTVDAMASKGLRANNLSSYTEIDAGYNPSKTTETLINYTACWVLGFVILRSCQHI